MSTTLAAALLALHLAGSPHAPPPAAPPPPATSPWDDDAGDLARLARLAERFDLAVIRRDLPLLRLVEGRVQEEIAAELQEARRERRRGVERRVTALERARRVFAEARERVDARSLDRKRTALAEVAQAAWRELLGVAGGQDRWERPRDLARDRERDRELERAWEHERFGDRQDDRQDDRRDDRRDEPPGWRPAAPPPPPPPAAPQVLPMRPERFDAVYRAMHQERFADGRLRVLDSALDGADAGLTVEQVGRLLGLFSFASEQLEVVRRVRPHLVDPDQGFRLYDRFTFSSDQDELRRILAP